MKLFVYGTLKRGFGNHVLLEGATYLGEDSISGRMISLGGFPGWLGEGEGRTYGEVYEIDDRTLQSTDMLEGYRQDNPSDSFYVREVVRTHSGQEVSTYRYNGGKWYGREQSEADIEVWTSD